mgnify:CR=1 FL=1
MTRNFYLLSFGIGAMMLATSHAQAQGANCAPHAVITERLAANYGERRQSIGLGSNNTVVEVFASDTTGTWSITVTAAGGLTCLVAAGSAYQTVADALPDTGDPA